MSDNNASLKKETIIPSTNVSDDNESSRFEEGAFDDPVGNIEENNAAENLNKMMEESFKGFEEEPILPTSPLEKDYPIPELPDSPSPVPENNALKAPMDSKEVIEKDVAGSATDKVSPVEKEASKKEENVPSEIAASEESDPIPEQVSANPEEIQIENSRSVEQVPESENSVSTPEKTSHAEIKAEKKPQPHIEIEKESTVTEVKQSSEAVAEEEKIETKDHVETLNPVVKQEVTSKSTEKKSDSNQDMFDMTEEEALAFLKEEEDARKAQAALGPPKIEIYGSSVSGNMKIKKAQNVMINTLERFKIEFDFVDLAADDQARLYIKRKNPTSTNIPQLYINGEFKMEFAEFEELLEYDELFEALGVEPDF